MPCQGGTSPGASTRGQRDGDRHCHGTTTNSLLHSTTTTTTATTTVATAIMGAALSLPFLAMPAVSTVRRAADCTRVTNKA
jgi:hypothetical protein